MNRTLQGKILRDHVCQECVKAICGKIFLIIGYLDKKKEPCCWFFFSLIYHPCWTNEPKRTYSVNRWRATSSLHPNWTIGLSLGSSEPQVLGPAAEIPIGRTLNWGSLCSMIHGYLPWCSGYGWWNGSNDMTITLTIHDLIKPSPFSLQKMGRAGLNPKHWMMLWTGAEGHEKKTCLMI